MWVRLSGMRRIKVWTVLTHTVVLPNAYSGIEMILFNSWRNCVKKEELLSGTVPQPRVTSFSSFVVLVVSSCLLLQKLTPISLGRILRAHFCRSSQSLTHAPKGRMCSWFFRGTFVAT